ncbi:MAG: fibronectin/fibrinogen-binding protein, partial [Firmicutes bacterium]|nr:fibronectin/fibrinogen-binding protein [Bacillota bacterium]
MAYDGLVMAAIAAELNAWCDARIEKIFQPEATTLSLLLHHRQLGKGRLILSANPRLPRVHLTTTKAENPLTPPMFCMLLRKHLEGAKLLKVEQLGLERVLTLNISGKDELGNLVTYRLIAEIMGRHSNIALVGPDNKVIDSIIRVPPAMSSIRIMLPGISYQYPGHQERTDTLSITNAQELQVALENSAGNLSKTLVRRLTGISPLLANELLARAQLPTNITAGELTTRDWDRLWQEIANLQTIVQTANFSPSHFDNDYAAINITHKQAAAWADSVNELVDQQVRQKLEGSALQQTKRRLHGIVKHLLQKEARKLGNQERELATMQEDLDLRLAGELILANMHLIQPKATKAELVNYYDPELANVTIGLDPSLDAVQNAQRYFKRYERARNGIPIVEKNIAATKRMLSYLQSLEDSLARAETAVLVQEIEAEMQQSGLLPTKQKTRKKEKEQPSTLLRFQSPSGREILVGRNNLQNERLLRSAAPDDWWLHAKDIPGSHVLIKGSNEPDAPTLEMAAQLAAYYSQARQGSKVPVDYTRRKHVKKPSGSPPGYVIYTEQKTVLVEPVGHEASKL